MAKFAKTVTVATTSTNITPPDDVDFLVRIENLDSTNSVWLNIIGTTAAAEADECVRIPPGLSYYARRLSSYEAIAISSSVKLLLESSNGRA